MSVLLNKGETVSRTTEVLEVTSYFELLTGNHEEVRHVRSMITIHFKATPRAESLITTKHYYLGHVECEFDRDDERRDEYGSDDYYMVHITALGDMSRMYGDAVKQLLGREIHDMLQLSWREEEIALLLISSGEYDFKAAYAARSINQVEREMYEISIANASEILTRSLPDL